MVVRQEDAPDRSQLQLGQHELPGHAVAAIDHVGRVADHDDLSRGRAIRLGRRTARRSEQDQARLASRVSPRLARLARGPVASERERRDHRRSRLQELPPVVGWTVRIHGSPFQSVVCPRLDVGGCQGVFFGSSGLRGWDVLGTLVRRWSAGFSLPREDGCMLHSRQGRSTSSEGPLCSMHLHIPTYPESLKPRVFWVFRLAWVAGCWCVVKGQTTAGPQPKSSAPIATRPAGTWSASRLNVEGSNPFTRSSRKSVQDVAAAALSAFLIVLRAFSRTMPLARASVPCGPCGPRASRPRSSRERS